MEDCLKIEVRKMLLNSPYFNNWSQTPSNLRSLSLLRSKHYLLFLEYGMPLTISKPPSVPQDLGFGVCSFDPPWTIQEPPPFLTDQGTLPPTKVDVLAMTLKSKITR